MAFDFFKISQNQNFEGNLQQVDAISEYNDRPKQVRCNSFILAANHVGSMRPQLAMKLS